CPKPLGKMFLYTKRKKNNICLSYLEGFSRASFYQMALEQLHSHPEVLEPPSKHNFVDITMITMSQIAFLLSDNLHPLLKIPVFGSKSEGHLYTRSPRVALFQRWQLQEVVLEPKDGQKIPVFVVREKI
uniref:Uncharacterized protein n=1 Tax=Spermophilus dauricus TaxID=99837 RepID=A0A8C9PXB2_SPEDA